MDVQRIAKHLRKYLLLYSILSIAIGLAVGYRIHSFVESNREVLRNLIVLFAVLTIYPSMVQLELKRLREIAKFVKAIAVGVLLTFVIAPAIAFIFANYFTIKQLSLGFVITNIVPASSASIGYVLISRGNIELATAFSIISLVASIITIPLYTSFYAELAMVRVPIGLVMESLALTLITPLVLGQLTKRVLILSKMKSVPGVGKELNGRELEKRLRPHLSLWTMVTMLVLIFLLVTSKAGMIICEPATTLKIVVFQVAMICILFLLATLIDRLAGLSYEEHVAIAFLSSTKNASVAAAISAMALGTVAALPAALVPIVQAPVAITYIHVLPYVQKLFRFRGVG